MAKGYEMDMQHMPALRPLCVLGLWARHWPSRLLEALQKRPQSQRLGIIYMQIHTFQVQTQPTCRPKQQYTSQGTGAESEGARYKTTIGERLRMSIKIYSSVSTAKQQARTESCKN